MITIEEATTLIGQQARSFGVEVCSIHEAKNRVLAEAIFADRDYPPFNRTAMDGFAIISDDFINGGLREFKILEEIFAGAEPTKQISSGQCYKIMTGASVPLTSDSVIRIEDCELEEGIVKLKIDQIKKGQNIAKKAEDCGEGELILKKNTRLNAPEIAVLAVTGKSEIVVYKIPKVVIISTGNEIISIDKPASVVQIRDSNTYALKAFLENYKINVENIQLVPDDKNILKYAISKSLDADVIILSGGVSMGDADFVPEILTAVGVKKIFHKVNIKPGKPLWFGATENNTVVFGLPGNPMSVQVVYKIFVEPFLRKCFGMEPSLQLQLPILSTKKKKVKLNEFFPCIIEHAPKFGIRPTSFNGSGDIKSTIYSHGIAIHKADEDELAEGDLVNFFLWENYF